MRRGFSEQRPVNRSCSGEPMSIASIVQGALKAVPSELRGPITVRRTRVKSVDFVTDEQRAAKTEMTITNALMFPPKDDRFGAQSSAKIERREVHVAGADCVFTPSMGDTAEAQGMRWKVIYVYPLQPGAVLEYVRFIIEGTR